MNDLQLAHHKKLLLRLQKELKEVTESARELSRPVDLDQTSVGRLSRMDAMQSQAILSSRKSVTRNAE